MVLAPTRISAGKFAVAKNVAADKDRLIS